MHWLWKVLDSVYWRLPRLSRVIKVQGRQPDAHRCLTILTNTSRRFRNHLAEMTFGESGGETRFGRTWRCNFRRRAQDIQADIFVLTGICRSRCRRYENARTLFFSHWVLGEIDFNLAFKRIETSSQVKRFVQKFRANQLHYEVTRDPARIKDFYHNMHVPYVRQRFGEAGVVVSARRLRKRIHQLEVALVRQGPEYIAGHLLFYGKKGNVAHWTTGLKDGDPGHLRTGAGAALYYNNILYLAEKGFKSMRCGWSRTFLHDGILQHKKLWGMRLIDTYLAGSVMVALNDTPETRMFFQNTPLICVSNNMLTGILFARPGDLQSERDLIRMHRKYYIDGMDRLRVLVTGDPAEYPSVPDELDGDLNIESADRFFGASHTT